MKITDQRLTNEDRRALAELAKTDRRAFAEVITEYVDPVYLTLDLMGQFMNTREITLGDMYVKSFKGKYHVQQIVPGQITLGEQITVRNKALSYNLDILSAKAKYNELELAHGGPAYRPETVRSDVRKALDEKLVMRGWNALGNIWTTGNAAALTYGGSSVSNFIDASGALTSTVLDQAIDHVNYWSEGVRTIIGTEQALAPLSTFGQYRILSDTTPDYGILQNLQGAPGTFQNVSPYGPGSKAVETYRGVTNIVRLKQIFDETQYPKRPLLPTDFVLVVGENIGEFITYGGAQTKEWTDMEPTPPYWNYETYLQFGMMIWNAKGLVKIKVTSTTP
jgi:hypothetical protein